MQVFCFNGFSKLNALFFLLMYCSFYFIFNNEWISPDVRNLCLQSIWPLRWFLCQAPERFTHTHASRTAGPWVWFSTCCSVASSPSETTSMKLCRRRSWQGSMSHWMATGGSECQMMPRFYVVWRARWTEYYWKYK